MPKWVIKRGGKKQAWSSEKVKGSIRKACKDARVPGKRTKTVVNRVFRAVMKSVGKRSTVRTAVIRKKALAALGKLEPKAARAWRKYDARRRARRRKR